MLKQEPGALVELLGTGRSTVVRKTYRNRGLRWWQSFGRRSRAEREFENLRHLEACGTTCPPAIEWSARTRCGFVDESTIVTRFVPGCDTLKGVLGGVLVHRDRPERRILAAAAGRLLAELHRNGFLWCSPMPRNVLVLGEPAHARLAVCDAPRGIPMRRPLHASRMALIDLYDAAFSPSRRKDYSATDRLRWLLGYCDGDRATARRLWRAITSRGVWRHEMTRSLAVFWFNYVLRPLRARPRLRTS